VVGEDTISVGDVPDVEDVDGVKDVDEVDDADGELTCGSGVIATVLTGPPACTDDPVEDVATWSSGPASATLNPARTISPTHKSNPPPTTWRRRRYIRRRARVRVSRVVIS
jgi:hypothetical protein